MRLYDIIKKSVLVFVLIGASAFGNPLTAQSWLIAEKDGQIIAGENVNEVRAIASITKLVTVMVFLDSVPNPTSKQEKWIHDAITLSSNKSAKDLCDNHPEGYSRCVHLMNLKAQEIGLFNTRFLEPTGLSVFNVSTAEELVKIVKESSKYPLIVRYSNDAVRNTNPTIGKYDYIVSKTGYINKSGGCIVAMIQDKIYVLLGSKNTKTRIAELEYLKRQHTDAARIQLLPKTPLDFVSVL